MRRRAMSGSVVAALAAGLLLSSGVAAWGVAVGTTWSQPVATAYTTPNISDSGQSVDEPQVAVSGQTAVSVWYRSDGANYIVQAAASTDGGATWGTPTSLSAAGQDARRPQIAVDGSTAIATWYRNDGAFNRVQVARSTDGGVTWGAPATLSAAGGNVNTQQVALDGTIAIVTWNRYDGANWIVQATSSSDSGATWGVVNDVSAAGRDGMDQQIAVSGTTAIITWQRYNGADTIVQASASGNGGNIWSTPVDLSAPLRDANYPQIAMSGNNAVVVWQRYDGANWLIQSTTTSDYGATWSIPTGLSAVGRNAQQAQVAMSGSNAVATWMRTNGLNQIIQAIVSTDSGATWGAAADLSAPGQNASAPQLGMSGTTATVVWSRPDGANDIVQQSTMASLTSGWAAASDLTATGFNASNPQVALGSSAGSIVWMRSNGLHALVQAAYTLGYAYDPGSTIPRGEFTYYLPDGRECGAISPQVEIVGTMATLPGADADCGYGGSTIVGWRIPGQEAPLRPGRTVEVIDSQQFTAVLQLPTVRVVFDANVAAADACLDSSGTSLAVSARTTEQAVTRDGVTSVAAPKAAACTPAGVTLAGWTYRPTGTVIGAGYTLPAPGEDVNVMHLYAIWK